MATHAIEPSLESLFDGIQDLMYVTDEKRHICYANAAFARIFGIRDKARLIGSSIDELYVVPSHRTLFEDSVAFFGGRVENYMVMVKRRRPHEVFCLSVDSNWVDGDRANGVEGTGRDMTSVIRILPAFFQVRVDGILTYCSDGYAKLFGYDTAVEIIGRQIDAVSHANPSWKGVCSSGAVAPGGAPMRFDCRDRAGRRLVLEVAMEAFVVRRSKAMAYQGTIRDVTALTEKNTQLNESLSMNRILVDNSWDGVYLIRDRFFISANATLCETLGYRPGRLAGTPYLDLAVPEDQALVLDQVTRKLADRRSEPSEYEFQAVTREGLHRVVRVKSARCTYEGMPAVYGYLRDVTDERQHVLELERRVQEATRKLTRALEEKELLLAAAVHEMDSPIAAIKNHVHLLRESGKGFGSRFADDLLKDMLVICDIMSNVVANVRIARTSKDDLKERYKCEWVSFRDSIIDPALELMQGYARDHGVPTGVENVSINLIQSPAYVFCNPSLFIQAITNILDNAVKYAKEKPAVFRLEVGAYRRKNGDIALTFKDSGIGIPKGESQRIFGNGVKGSNARSIPGMGLGLWVVRGVLDAAGWRVTVSKREEPTVFTIVIPRKLVADTRPEG